jgi:hypothetical protein
MIKKYLDNVLTDKHKEFLQWNTPTTQKLLNALNNSVVTQEYGVGLPYWSKQNPLLIKNFTWLMARLHLGTTTISRNYSRFEFNMAVLDHAKVLKYRIQRKLDNTLMTKDLNTYSNTLVKRNGTIHDDGIPRPGMMKASKRMFKIDTDYLEKYKRPIKQNLIKSIKKGIEKGNINDKFFSDEASYREVVNLAVEHYLNPEHTYNSEYNIQDQRGRAVKQILKRVGNYISSKDFRALLKVPTTHAVYITKDSISALEDIYYFIAELTGNKCLGGTEADKIETGRQAYLNRELPILNLKNEEDRKDLHELIWLERIYQKLNIVLNSKLVSKVLWDIPLEIDNAMSLAQIVGALTNDERVLKSTGVIGNILSDPWYIKGVRRLVAKTVGTPVFYGSSQSAVSLVRGKDLTLDKEELRLLKKEFSTGRFSVLKQFKDLLISNYSMPIPIININLGIYAFQIHVNKFKTAGYKTIVTEAFNGTKFKYSFTKEPELVPDYKRMKLFWATCLVHSLDSDLMEHGLNRHSAFWILDIHDADLCLPGQAHIIRQTKADRLKYYNRNRFQIVSSYRQSIGATTPKSDIDYMKLLKSVIDAGDQTFMRTCMK